jgi:hypothetical protein
VRLVKQRKRSHDNYSENQTEKPASSAAGCHLGLSFGDANGSRAANPSDDDAAVKIPALAPPLSTSRAAVARKPQALEH